MFSGRSLPARIIGDSRRGDSWVVRRRWAVSRCCASSPSNPDASLAGRPAQRTTRWQWRWPRGGGCDRSIAVMSRRSTDRRNRGQTRVPPGELTKQGLDVPCERVAAPVPSRRLGHRRSRPACRVRPSHSARRSSAVHRTAFHERDRIADAGQFNHGTATVIETPACADGACDRNRSQSQYPPRGGPHLSWRRRPGPGHLNPADLEGTPGAGNRDGGRHLAVGQSVLCSHDRCWRARTR
jgi:hypothetical protein